MFSSIIKRLTPLAIIAVMLLVTNPVVSKNTMYDFKPINVDKISRYREDRVAFQRIEKKINVSIDDSVETLLVIKDKKMYLIKDGYENPRDIKTKIVILEQERRLIPDDLWSNKINNKPDSIIITDRRQITLEKYDEKFVDETFGEFYRGVRNKFVQYHTKVFMDLMTNRKESNLKVVHKPIPKRIYDKGETKYFTSVAAKAIDDKHYYAEDADGDGITETFRVNIPDGFSWGYRSGANIIFIYNLSKENESSKEVLDIIKDLAAYGNAGTPESMKKIKEKFPEQDEVKRMIDDIYRRVKVDTDTYKPQQY